MAWRRTQFYMCMSTSTNMNRISLVPQFNWQSQVVVRSCLLVRWMRPLEPWRTWIEADLSMFRQWNMWNMDLAVDIYRQFMALQTSNRENYDYRTGGFRDAHSIWQCWVWVGFINPQNLPVGADHSRSKAQGAHNSSQPPQLHTTSVRLGLMNLYVYTVPVYYIYTYIIYT